MSLLSMILIIIIVLAVAETVYGIVKKSAALVAVGLVVAVMCALALYLALCCADSIYITGPGLLV